MFIEGAWEVGNIPLEEKANGFSGSIKIFEVNGEAFDRELTYSYPTCEEDWVAMVNWLEENGKLLETIKPDYSISVRC